MGYVTPIQITIIKISYDCLTPLAGAADANIIQLFRERLSEKVHATIPKGIVGSFKFTVP